VFYAYLIDFENIDYKFQFHYNIDFFSKPHVQDALMKESFRIWDSNWFVFNSTYYVCFWIASYSKFKKRKDAELRSNSIFPFRASNTKVTKILDMLHQILFFLSFQMVISFKTINSTSRRSWKNTHYQKEKCILQKFTIRSEKHSRIEYFLSVIF